MWHLGCCSDASFDTPFTLSFLSILQLFYVYTVLCPVSLKFCKMFLKCSTRHWADTEATVQPNL